MTSWKILTAMVLINCLVADGICYETPTHSEISNYALDNSMLMQDSGFLLELGITEGLEEPAFPGEVPIDEGDPFPDKTFYMLNAPIRRIIAGGAVLEDRSTNSLHHFFDVAHDGRGLTLEKGALFVPAGMPSPEWILEIKEQQNRVPLFIQNNSYRDAAQYYYRALTEPHQARRDMNFGLMFRGIGHVIHHIQDMAQPQHVRNDQHCDKKTSLICVFADNPSHYEKYTDVNRKIIVAGSAPGKVPVYPRARHFWSNQEGTGMAQFTQDNFVSQGTNFQLNSRGGLSASARYPSPVPASNNFYLTRNLAALLHEIHVNRDDINKVMENLDCHLPLICEMDFIATNVIERGGEISINERASTISLLDDELRERNLHGDVTTTYNRFNFHAAYPYLIPRAIAYSAGLINHFFRGRLEVTNTDMAGAERALVEVRNASAPGNSLKKGGFELYYDSVKGIRVPSGPLQITPGVLPLTAGDTLRFTTALPEDLDREDGRPFMLVFNALDGAIGSEGGVAAVNFQMKFTGKVERLARVADGCPGKIYSVRITFQHQPGGDGGRMLLRGVASGAVFDFRLVPENIPVIRQGSRWTHGPDVFSGLYLYQVTYRYPGSEVDLCAAPDLGAWIEDEEVKAVYSAAEE